MMFLLGRQAMLGHEPPIYLRSMIPTRFPSPARVHAASVAPVPPPRITMSNSSGCAFDVLPAAFVCLSLMRALPSQRVAVLACVKLTRLMTTSSFPSVVMEDAPLAIGMVQLGAIG